MYLNCFVQVMHLLFDIYRSGSDEEYDEKMKLLQEIHDKQEAGSTYLQEQREERKRKEKEEKKKLMLRKQGADIREKAMKNIGGKALYVKLVYLFSFIQLYLCIMEFCVETPILFCCNFKTLENKNYN